MTQFYGFYFGRNRFIRDALPFPFDQSKIESLNHSGVGFTVLWSRPVLWFVGPGALMDRNVLWAFKIYDLCAFTTRISWFNAVNAIQKKPWRPKDSWVILYFQSLYAGLSFKIGYALAARFTTSICVFSCQYQFRRILHEHADSRPICVETNVGIDRK